MLHNIELLFTNLQMSGSNPVASNENHISETERKRTAIIGRMVADGATEVTHQSITAHLAPCVCGPKLITLALCLMSSGNLSAADLRQMRADYDQLMATRNS